MKLISFLPQASPAKIVRFTDSLLNETGFKKDYEIDKFILHNTYKGTEHYNDIALIKLKDDITFTQNVRPACLWKRDILEKTDLVVIGMGKDGSENMTKKLMKVTLQSLNNAYCRTKFVGNIKGLPNGITDTLLCGYADKKDSCQGNINNLD